jgi:hypothetical protein
MDRGDARCGGSCECFRNEMFKFEIKGDGRPHSREAFEVVAVKSWPGRTSVDFPGGYVLRLRSALFVRSGENQASAEIRFRLRARGIVGHQLGFAVPGQSSSDVLVS